MTVLSPGILQLFFNPISENPLIEPQRTTFQLFHSPGALLGILIELWKQFVLKMCKKMIYWFDLFIHGSHVLTRNYFSRKLLLSWLLLTILTSFCLFSHSNLPLPYNLYFISSFLLHLWNFHYSKKIIYHLHGEWNINREKMGLSHVFKITCLKMNLLSYTTATIDSHRPTGKYPRKYLQRPH